VFLYVLGGLLASAAHWWVNPDSTMPVIGASGAIAAVLGAYAITWPWARVSTLVFLVVFVTIIDVPALVVLGAWFFMQLLMGQQSWHNAASGGVAWWAHVGGFLAGVLLMPVLSLLAGGSSGHENDIEF
jgi:membrane associated rhomboid family serine protease